MIEVVGVRGVDDILRDFELSDILEMCNITPEEVLEILVNGGHIELPAILQVERESLDESTALEVD